MVTAIKVYQRLFLNFHVRGRDNIPTGPKIFVINHITSVDHIWIMPVLAEPVHFIFGPGYQSRLTAWFLDFMQQINAMPGHRRTVVDDAMFYLKKGESVLIAPEGDLQEPFVLGKFYPGAAKIYQRIQVPFIPIALVAPPSAMRAYPWFDITVDDRVYRGIFVLRGPYFINVGKPYLPENSEDLDEREDQQRIMDELKSRISRLTDEVRSECDFMDAAE